MTFIVPMFPAIMDRPLKPDPGSSAQPESITHLGRALLGSLYWSTVCLFPQSSSSTFPKGLFQNLSTIRIFNPIALSLPLVPDPHSYFIEKIKIHELIAVLIPEPLNLSILTQILTSWFIDKTTKCTSLLTNSLPSLQNNFLQGFLCNHILSFLLFLVCYTTHCHQEYNSTNPLRSLS